MGERTVKEHGDGNTAAGEQHSVSIRSCAIFCNARPAPLTRHRVDALARGGNARGNAREAVALRVNLRLDGKEELFGGGAQAAQRGGQRPRNGAARHVRRHQRHARHAHGVRVHLRPGECKECAQAQSVCQSTRETYYYFSRPDKSSRGIKTRQTRE